MIHCIVALLSLGIVVNASVKQSGSEIYLPPPRIVPNAPSILLVFVPGGLVPNEDYIKPINATQYALSSRRSPVNLYAAILHCTLNLCVPPSMPSYVSSTIQAAETQFKQSFAPNQTVIGGHSLGGVGARYTIDDALAQSPPLVYAGLILYGVQFNDLQTPGVVGYPSDVAAFGVPLLALVGELDFVPTSHTALVYEQCQSLPTALDRFSKIAIVVAGMDHSDFCPGFHVQNDIVSELKPQVATGIIGNITAAWISVLQYQLAAQDATTLLKGYLVLTSPIVAPFLEARSLDADGARCINAQLYLGDITDAGANRLLVPSAQIVNDSFELTFAHPTLTLNDGVNPSTLSIGPVSYNEHELQIEPVYCGASEIACKAVSAEMVLQQLNIQNPSINVSGIHCRTLNEAAAALATALVQQHNARAWSRFVAHGRSLRHLPDYVVTAGPVWIAEELLFDIGTNETRIQSIALKTSVDSWIYPGSHYCKLVSGQT